MLRSVLNQARDLLRTRFVDGRPVDQDDVLYGGSKRWKGGATTKNEDGGNRRYETAFKRIEYHWWVPFHAQLDEAQAADAPLLY